MLSLSDSPTDVSSDHDHDHDHNHAWRRLREPTEVSDVEYRCDLCPAAWPPGGTGSITPGTYR